MKLPDIKNMTLRERIGQMFIMRDDRLYNMVSDDKLCEYLNKNPIGGIWATGRLKKSAAYLNFEASSEAGSLEDLQKYVNLLNSHSKIPLLVGGDSEKGGFMGSSEISGPDAVVAAADNKLTYKYSACMASELKCGGLNWRWSPISDLCHHDASISVNRVCSDDPQKVIDFSKAMIKGSQDVGVAATVKHFPGHDPDETRDPHFMTSVNNSSFEDWMNVQGRVYKEAIDSGVYSVMIGHHSFPAVDDSRIGTKRRPATFSKKIITDLLKNEWGFDGVVITDDIGMRAAFSIFGRENMADMYIELINAGNDMLLGTPIGDNFEDYITFIEDAVSCGRVSEERINDACNRILNMKQKLGLFESNSQNNNLEAAKKETALTNMEIARRSLTLLSNSSGFLPLDKSKVKKIAIISVTHTECFITKLEVLKAVLQKRGITVELMPINKCNVKETAQNNDVIIYANFVSAHQPMGRCSFFGDVAQQFFKILTFGSEKSIVVSFGSPFLRKEYYEETDTYINAYWYNKEVMEALTEAIFGDIMFSGKSPFEV